jgi:DNA primase
MNVRHEIERIVRSQLTGVGRTGPDDLSGRCPFHRKSDGSQERSASFAMNLDSGLWFCHSCGAKGNLFTFFRDLGMPRQEIHLNFDQLIEAAKENLPAAKDPRTVSLVDKNPLDHRLLGLLDYMPNDLLRAGFLPDTLRSFEVGFDRWHYRVTYPIRDIVGQLVGISGRTVIDAVPRYKVYDKEYIAWGLGERQGWQRGNVLYNAWQLYGRLYHCSEPTEIVIVEGFKACMWVHQAGFTNVVGLLGHYLTQPQQWILENTGAKLYLFLDNNPPGWDGCEKAGLALAKTIPHVHVILYPERLWNDEDAQPDSCTVDEIHQQKENAIPYYSFRSMRR